MERLPQLSNPMMPRLLCCCCYGVCLTAASATQIDWNGFPFSTNLTSTGQPWDDTWVAELGSFTGGFTPTAANTPQWAAAWRAASRSVYQPVTRYFGGSYNYDTNVAPFLTGTQAYLWLFHPGAPQGEWVLLTHPSWTWPAGSPGNFFPLTWASTDASQAVVGQLAAPGWDLKSAAILNSPLPVLTFTEWQPLYFTAGELANPALSGSNADPDGDGGSNLMEYAAGSLPRRATSFPAPAQIFLHPEDTPTHAAARLFRSTRLTGYTWQAQASEPLSGWNGTPVTLTDFPWEWTVRYPTPLSTTTRGFLRFRLAP